jgi:chloramphenicol O-acetyltransferase type A
MAFRLIDLDSYPRREHFETFLRLNLTYSATVQIDITDLRRAVKSQELKAYPAQIWMLTRAANTVPEFRMSLDANDQLGTWDRLEPLYTCFDDDSKSFSGIWTPFDDDFGRFHRSCLADMERFTTGTFQPQPDVPENVLNISSIPWVDFTAFNLNMPTNYLLPILTIGKYFEKDGRTQMPFAIQVHHAVCDGYHFGLFIEQVRLLAATVSTWLLP